MAMFGAEPLELRASADGDRFVTGYAAVWGAVADLMVYHETIKRGAFAKSIRDKDIRILYGHNHEKVLGRQSAGTLRLQEDEKGLWIRAYLPSWAAWIAESVARRDITGMSFGFTVPRDGDTWRRTDKGLPLRELVQIDLSEVSIVTWPAYVATSVSVLGVEDPKVKADLTARRKRLNHLTAAAARESLDRRRQSLARLGL